MKSNFHHNLFNWGAKFSKYSQHQKNTKADSFWPQVIRFVTLPSQHKCTHTVYSCHVMFYCCLPCLSDLSFKVQRVFLKWHKDRVKTEHLKCPLE